MRHISFLLLAVVLALGLLEAGLTLNGWILRAPQQKLNRLDAADGDSFRILTLGESTSADFCIHADTEFCRSCPRQLEDLLRDAGVKARVYNEAVPGISTPFILQHLPEWLKRYQPHVVVSMMGINDIRLRPVVMGGTFWTRLHLVRIGRWAYNALLGPKLSEDDQTSWSAAYHRISPEVQKLPIKKWESEVPQRIRGLPALEQGFIWGQLGNNCEGLSQIDSSVKLSDCRIYVERGYELAPRNREVISFVIYIARTQEDLARIDQIAEDILKNRISLNDEILTLFMTLNPQKNPIAWKVLRGYGIEPGPDSESPSKLFEARLAQIQNLIEKNGAIHLRMQYPTLSVEDLARRYGVVAGTQLSSLGFIENKENFQKALAKHKYDEIFTDRFEATWGHTTHFGHSLIAAQVVPSILAIKLGLVRRVK